MMMKMKKLRESKGWSRNELARRARMGAPDVGRIESGGMVAYDSQLKKLATALGVTVEELKGGNHESA